MKKSEWYIHVSANKTVKTAWYLFHLLGRMASEFSMKSLARSLNFIILAACDILSCTSRKMVSWFCGGYNWKSSGIVEPLAIKLEYWLWWVSKYLGKGRGPDYKYCNEGLPSGHQFKGRISKSKSRFLSRFGLSWLVPRSILFRYDYYVSRLAPDLF